jgi:hypothetical protein
MATYEVGMEFDSTVWVSVEADSEEEAQEKVEDTFDPAAYMEVIANGYWTPGEVELVDDGTEEENE